LTDVKTNLQTIINKLNQPCGGDTIKVDICNIADSPIDTYANDTFQITDCAGLPIGTPQNIKKTVVLNTTTTNICNVQELADAIKLVPEYNTEEEILLLPNTVYTISSGTVHKYAVSVLGNGTASTIKVGAGLILPIKNGYHKQIEFTNLNTQEVIFTCGTGDEIRIILTKI